MASSQVKEPRQLLTSLLLQQVGGLLATLQGALPLDTGFCVTPGPITGDSEPGYPGQDPGVPVARPVHRGWVLRILMHSPQGPNLGTGDRSHFMPIRHVCLMHRGG